MYPDTLANVLSTWQQLHSSPNNRESSPGRGLNMVRLRGHSSYARERRGRERTTRGQGFRRITSRNNSSMTASVVRAWGYYVNICHGENIFYISGILCLIVGCQHPYWHQLAMFRRLPFARPIPFLVLFFELLSVAVAGGILCALHPLLPGASNMFGYVREHNTLSPWRCQNLQMHCPIAN